MSGLQAARMGDAIGHAGALIGLAIGLAAGVEVGLALAALVLTQPIAGTYLAVGAACVTIGAIGVAAIGKRIAKHWGGTTKGNGMPCSMIPLGSPDTRIEDQPAARAMQDLSGPCLISLIPPQPLPQGSALVFVNDRMLVRATDTAGCGGTVVMHALNVWVGGPAGGTAGSEASDRASAGHLDSMASYGSTLARAGRAIMSGAEPTAMGFVVRNVLGTLGAARFGAERVESGNGGEEGNGGRWAGGLLVNLADGTIPGRANELIAARTLLGELAPAPVPSKVVLKLQKQGYLIEADIGLAGPVINPTTRAISAPPDADDDALRTSPRAENVPPPCVMTSSDETSPDGLSPDQIPAEGEKGTCTTCAASDPPPPKAGAFEIGETLKRLYYRGNPDTRDAFRRTFYRADVAAEPFGERGPLFTDGTQGALGDCYVIATLKALALMRPDILRKAITKNADGSFDVTFDQRAHTKVEDVNVEIPARHSVQRVTRSVPTDGDSQSPTPIYARQIDGSWVQLFEKAYAQEYGGGDGYLGIGNEGHPSDVMSNLGLHGEHSTTAGVPFELMKMHFDAGLPMVAITDKKPGLVDLPARHAFTITSVYIDASPAAVAAAAAEAAAIAAAANDPDPAGAAAFHDSEIAAIGGVPMIGLHNPWNGGVGERDGSDSYGGDFTMTYAAFAKGFSHFARAEPESAAVREAARKAARMAEKEEAAREAELEKRRRFELAGAFV